MHARSFIRLLHALTCMNLTRLLHDRVSSADHARRYAAHMVGQRGSERELLKPLQRGFASRHLRRISPTGAGPPGSDAGMMSVTRQPVT